jgi:hypothetical protein
VTGCWDREICGDYDIELLLKLWSSGVKRIGPRLARCIGAFLAMSTSEELRNCFNVDSRNADICKQSIPTLVNNQYII